MLSTPDANVEGVKRSHSAASKDSTFVRSTGFEAVGNLRNVCGFRVQVILEMCTFVIRSKPTFNTHAPFSIVVH